MSAEDDFVSAELDAEAVGDLVDRAFEGFVCERADVAGLLVDEVVVMGFGIGDLVAGHAVLSVEAVQEAEVGELLDDAIDRGGRPCALGAQLVGDLLRAQETLPFAGKEFDEGGSRGAGSEAGVSRAAVGVSEPAVAEVRVDARSLPRLRTTLTYCCATASGPWSSQWSPWGWWRWPSTR